MRKVLVTISTVCPVSARRRDPRALIRYRKCSRRPLRIATTKFK